MYIYMVERFSPRRAKRLIDPRFKPTYRILYARLLYCAGIAKLRDAPKRRAFAFAPRDNVLYSFLRFRVADFV